MSNVTTAGLIVTKFGTVVTLRQPDEGLIWSSKVKGKDHKGRKKLCGRPKQRHLAINDSLYTPLRYVVGVSASAIKNEVKVVFQTFRGIDQSYNMGVRVSRVKSLKCFSAPKN